MKGSGVSSDLFSSIDKALPNLSYGWALFKEGLTGATSAIDVAKAAMSGFGAVISAHPIMAAVTAVGLLATAYDALTTSTAEAKQDMEDSMSQYESSKTELDNLNSELDNTQKSINELSSKKSLTFIEQSELSKLKEANQELQLQADLKEKENAKDAKDAANKAVTAFNKEFKHDISKSATKEYFDNASLTGNNAILFSDETNLSAMIAGIQQFQKLKKAAINSGDKEEATRYAEIIDDAKDSVWGQVEVLNDYKQKLESLPTDTLTTSQKDALNTIKDSIDYVYQTLDPNKWKSMKFDDIFSQNQFSDAKESLVNMAKATDNVGVSVDQVKNKYPGLVSAVEKAGFTVQDLVDNINSEAGIIDIDKIKNDLKDAFIPKFDGYSSMVTDKFKNDWDTFTKDFTNSDFEILYTIKQSNDTNGWSIDDWKTQYDLMKADAKNTESEPITFSSIMGDTEDGSLSKSIDDFQEKTSAVNTALQTLQEGGQLSASDISDLIQQFPQLANETDNLGTALANLNADNLSSMLSTIDEQMKTVTSDSDKKAFENLKNQLIDSVDLSGVDKSKVTDGLRNLFESNANDAVTRSFAKDQIAKINDAFSDELKTAEGKEILYKLSLKPEAVNWDMSEWQSQFDEELARTSKNTLEKYVTQATNDLSALQTATSEASSTTGLTKSSIDSISQMFSGIPNFDADALFRNTADGVKLNTKALSSLLSVQHDIKATEFAKDIQKQTEAIKKQNDAVQEAKGTADFDTQQTKLKDMLASLADMQQAQSQYHALYKQQQELFSDYGQWQQAQSTANAGDKYNNMVSGLQAAKDAWDKGLVGTDDFKSFAKLISPSGATDDVNFAENYAKAARYLTEDESGVKAFLNDLSSKGLADFNKESQQWSYNVKDMAEAAKQMGMGKEFMSNMFGRLEDYGFHNNVISDAEDGVLKLSDAYSNLAESEARLEDLKKNDPTNTTAIAQAEKEVSGYKQDIDELGTNLKEVASHTAENYNRELETAKNQMKTLADERERILKSNEYGDNTQAVADYMQSQIDQLGQNYGLDSSALQQQAEQAAKAYSDALQNATIENPVTPDFGEDTASADAYASAVDKVQQANKDNNQTLSDSIKTLQEYNSEQIKGIDLFDGAYDSDELKPAEQALDNICQSLGLTSEEAGLLGQVLESMGIIKPEVDDSEVKQAKTDAEETKQTYDNLGDSTVSINADVSGEDSVASFVDQCSSIQQGMTTTITATVSGESEVESLESGLEQIPDNTPTTVDVTVNNQQDLDNIQSKVDSLNAGGKDITLNAHIKPDANSEVEVKAKDTTVKVTPDPKEVEVTAKPVKVDVQPSQKEVGVSAKVTDKPTNVTSQGTINYKKGSVEKADGTTSQGIINYKKGDVEKADGTVSTGIINYNLGNVATPDNAVATGVINYTLGSVAKPKAASAAGTFGQSRAYAQGSLTDLSAYAGGHVSLPRDEKALVNEVGTESIVRDGQWSLIPGGAHLTNLKKGDIIFSASQTEDLLKRGATPGHARAYAQGSLSDISLTHAFDGGSGWGGFGGGLSNKTSVSSGSSGSSDTPATQQHTNAVKDDTSATEDNTKATKDSTEAFDGIKRYTQKLAKAVEQISNQITDYISSAFKTSLLKRQVKATEKQIAANEKASDAYMKKAESIGLSEEYKNKVINGTLTIEEIDTSSDSGKQLAKDIKNFENYYDASRDCKDTVQELNNKLLELYETIVNMPTEKAEKKIDRLKTKLESLNAVSDTVSLGGSAIAAMQNQIKVDIPGLGNAQKKLDKAETARNATKKTRVKASRDLKSATADAESTGNALIKTSEKQTKSIGKKLKNAAKSSTNKATYNAIAQAVREGKPVNLKGLKGATLKYAKSYNSSLKQGNTIASKVKAGKTVKTSGMSNILKSTAQAYNADAKEKASAQKVYDNAKKADEKALNDLTKAQKNKEKLYSGSTKEQQILATTKGKKSYVYQNMILTQETKNLKEQNKQRQKALKETRDSYMKAKSNYNTADADKTKSQNKLLNNKTVMSKLNKTQQKALKAGKTVSTKGITDPKVLKWIQDYNEKVKKSADLSKKLRIEQEALDKATSEAAQSQAEYAQSIVENAKKKLENIANYYDSFTSQWENRNSMYEAYMDRMQTQGYNLSTKFYEAEIGQQQKIVDNLSQKYIAMKRNFANLVADPNSGIKEGTEEYYEMQNEIDQVAISLKEAQNKVVEFQAAIRDLKWEQFDQLQDAIGRITSESDFLIDLMSHKDMYDKDGKMTEQGLATMGLHGVNYNTYMAQADKYKEEMLKISEELANDPNNQKLIDRKNELIDAQQQAILSAENEKDSIKDLIQDGIDKQLDALDDLIDKYLDCIDSEKSLYEYRKKIGEQSEKIASLQKQLSSLQGDNSEENKAKLQKLKEDLKSAQDDMEETQYDKYVSDQKKLLDELKQDYKKALDDRMDNVDVLISDAIASINSNSSNISQTLQTESKNVGYTLSGEMQTIWTSQSQVLSLYDDKFKTRFTGVTTAIGNVYERQKSMIDAIDKMAEKLVAKADQMLQQPTQTKTDDNKTDTGKTDDNKTDTNTGDGKDHHLDGALLWGEGEYDKLHKNDNNKTGNNKAEVGDKVTYVSGRYYGDSDGGHGSGNYYLGKKVKITRINKGSKYPYAIDATDGTELGWVKLNQLKGYASGIMRVPNDQLAWTQEQGEEAIIRNDGSILTPLSRDVSVLNADMTKNLWDFMGNPGSFLNDYSDGEKFGVKNVDNSSSVDVGGVTIQCNMPNVQNANDLLHELTTNKDIEKAICAMTIGRAMGGSSLAKYKYKK